MPQATIEQAIQIALQHHQAGRLAEAESIYRQILNAQPNHADALHLLGTLRISTGQPDGAGLIRQAIVLKPNFPQALSNLGEALRMQGQLDEAIECFRRSLAIWPDFPAALGNLGLTLTMTGQNEQAIQSLRRAVALQPDFVDAWANLGSALNAAGQRSEAIACYQRAIAMRPTSAEFLNNLGVLLRADGQIEAAIAIYQRAISAGPGILEAYCNLADLLRAVSQQQQAIEVCQRGLAVRPDFPELHLSYANALHELGQIDQAISIYRRALELRPDWPEPLSNLGLALPLRSRFDEAIDCCRKAIAGRKDYAEAHGNLALILLLLGQWRDGWQEYEWRYRASTFPNAHRFTTGPFWDGSDLNGRTILLRFEQGVGDTIQFVRYLPKVIARSGSVILEVPLELRRLLEGANSCGVTVITENAVPLPPFDVLLPLMSLPNVLGDFDLYAVPKPPYLKADPALQHKWHTRLSADRQPKIGLAWAGNPKHHRDRSRSIPLSMLAPLAHEKLRFYSLQFGAPAVQASSPPTGMTLINMTGDIHDFADTAALIAELDLIISVDTAVAHLAGAMGKPVWLLLPLVPDFRWLLERSDTPWYPTMRLFRQKIDGDWNEPISRVAAELHVMHF